MVDYSSSEINWLLEAIREHTSPSPPPTPRVLFRLRGGGDYDSRECLSGTELHLNLRVNGLK